VLGGCGCGWLVPRSSEAPEAKSQKHRRRNVKKQEAMKQEAKKGQREMESTALEAGGHCLLFLVNGISKYFVSHFGPTFLRLI
jgi:hypothetical protein